MDWVAFLIGVFLVCLVLVVVVLIVLLSLAGTNIGGLITALRQLLHLSELGTDIRAVAAILDLAQTTTKRLSEHLGAAGGKLEDGAHLLESIAVPTPTLQTKSLQDALKDPVTHNPPPFPVDPHVFVVTGVELDTVKPFTIEAQVPGPVSPISVRDALHDGAQQFANGSTRASELSGQCGNAAAGLRKIAHVLDGLP